MKFDALSVETQVRSLEGCHRGGPAEHDAQLFRSLRSDRSQNNPRLEVVFASPFHWRFSILKQNGVVVLTLSGSIMRALPPELSLCDKGAQQQTAHHVSHPVSPVQRWILQLKRSSVHRRVFPISHSTRGMTMRALSRNHRPAGPAPRSYIIIS